MLSTDQIFAHGAGRRNHPATGDTTPRRISRGETTDTGASEKLDTGRLSVQQEWLPAAIKKIHTLKDEMMGFPNVPEPLAVSEAEVIARRLSEAGIRPRRIVPMADGGVCFTFATEDRRARIEVTNDVSIVVVTSESAESEANYEEAPGNGSAVALLVGFIDR